MNNYQLESAATAGIAACFEPQQPVQARMATAAETPVVKTGATKGLATEDPAVLNQSAPAASPLLSHAPVAAASLSEPATQPDAGTTAAAAQLRLKAPSDRWAKAGTLLYPLLFGVLIFILWQSGLLHILLGTDDFTLPAPSRIVRIMIDNSGKIWANVITTLQAALSGLFFGSLLGFLTAFLAMRFPRWGSGGLTLVSAFNAIPIIALAPVITNWTKDVSSEAATRSMVAKILVVTLVCMASMSVNAYRGLTELKPFSLDLMHSYGSGRGAEFIKLRLPNCIPYIFTALKVGVPTSVISAMIAEYFAEFITGVGRQIRENIVLAQYPTAWAYIMTACLMGIILYAILISVETVALRHRR
ncbi:MAG: ABC transporter permease subunit [Oscillospiraceae bacterium]|nr:ABC transporter permease subunit [Oscillospiraceae bacterium]MDD4368242.1 ABC transporter permease subunit [Oscillospiraceae bacterium]